MTGPLLIFDLIGSSAHFRKFYTNSSSLSYAFPTRTVITGLLAGLLGEPRDSYYETFSLEKCQIALSIRTPARKLIQTVNYVQTRTASEFTGSAGGTQIPLELILPLPKQHELRYRIYLTHKDKQLLQNISSTVNDPTYPPYLGLTECPGYTELVAQLSSHDWHLTETDEPQSYRTIIPASKLDGGLYLEEGVQVLKEKIPLDFDQNRRIRAVGDVLYERSAKPIRAKLSGESFHVTYYDLTTNSELSEWGVFLG